MTLEQLKAACRANDEDALGDGGLGRACRNAVVALDDLAYIAHQRALRVILLRRGEEWQEVELRPDEIKLRPDEISIFHLLTATEMDGIAIGLRAARMEQQDAIANN